MSFKFALIIPCCLLFGFVSCKPRMQEENEDLWLKNLINSILEDNFTYKTIIITDKEQKSFSLDAKISKMIAEFSRKIPVILFEMEEIIHSRDTSDTFVCDMSRFEKENVFFVYINTFGYSLPQEKNATDMLRWLSCNTVDPKILVVQFHERDLDFGDKLRYAWKRKILDYTILNIVVKKEKRSFFLPEDIITWVSYFVHRFNPFTDVYTNEEYKPGIEFFPEKLRNMNGYKMNTSMIHHPPASDLKKNEAGQVIDVTGTDGMTLKAIENTLNFKANLITSKYDTFGKILPNGSATLIFKELQEGNIEFISTGAFVFRSPMHKRVERSRFIRVEQCCTLVPIIPETKILISTESYKALLVTAAVVLVVWITTILMKFDPELMDPLKLICMLMTVALSREPGSSQLVERIIFGSCLIVSLAYSSTVFAQLTDILMQTGSEKPFNSFEDLDKSGLHLLMHPNLISNTFVDVKDGTLLSLKKKTTEYLLSNECPKILLKYQNVTCAGVESWSKMVVQMTRKHNDYTMKLAKPCFWSATMAYILEKGSPYVTSFNTVISRVIEGGLVIKWNDDYTREAMFEAKRKERASEGSAKEISQLAAQLYNVVIFGSLVSFVVLVGEFIIFRIQNKRSRIVKRNRVHNVK